MPSDRVPLPDWRERVDYFCGRIEQFHQREYQGQSTLTTSVRDEPFTSEQTTEQLRGGDGDYIFFRTLREVDNALDFGADRGDEFPILLILSDVNWRPLDDFYRLKPTDDGDLAFEGNYSRSQHFPGAASGGARATYLADRGVGWGLVSADGWRVPYRGSDCVVYHEGVGHTVGLPHPQPGDGSVMSLGQYRGWISESWLNDDQKERLGWESASEPIDRHGDLFSVFRAIRVSPIGFHRHLSIVVPVRGLICSTAGNGYHMPPYTSQWESRYALGNLSRHRFGRRLEFTPDCFFRPADVATYRTLRRLSRNSRGGPVSLAGGGRPQLDRRGGVGGAAE